ncbi:MAG: RagB/SusD family nutrient uptake outer membrane protein [Prevotellaceae bacterium]|nr:RagB/SusD family nutrient uptake outer membrane protein [Prevotellaceae bacterium]
MKTTVKNIIISFVAMVSLSLISCENMLDTEQHGVKSIETFYKTDEDAEQAITTVYLYYSNSGTYYNIFFLKNLLSDDFWSGGGGRGDNGENEKLNEYTFDAEHPYMRDAFQNFYGVIYRSNLILENVPDESSIQKRTRAEAKVFRAFAYIDLISMWGTPPFVDHTLQPAEYRQPNGDPALLWELVETDLTEAISSGALREKSNANDNSSYRITKQFAQALLGKAYIFQEKYGSAVTVLDDAITSNKYDLFTGNYGDMLQFTDENNCESVFELNYLNDPNNAAVINLVFAMTGWRTDKMTITSDIYNGTWGFCNPQKELYDAFVSVEGANGYRLTETMKTYDQVKANGDQIIAGNELYGHEGYFMWKTRKVKGELNTGGWMDSHNNVRIMRFAEVLLLAAEAHIKGGTASKATEYVNRVRTRAHLASKASVTMDDLMLEKRLELCGECVRYQDMLRWKIADKMVNQGKNTPWFQSSATIRWVQYNTGDAAGFKTSKHWLLPFPQTELTLNPNITQNTGW